MEISSDVVYPVSCRVHPRVLEAPLVDVRLLVFTFGATFQGAYSLIEVSLPGKEHTGAKDSMRISVIRPDKGKA